MTSAEFKEANPEYAHLEGDELWNAMEDHFLANARPFEKPKDFFDWQGNKIKDGDEILVIRTKPLFGKTQFCMMDTQTGALEVLSEYTPPDRCWQLCGEYIIEQRSDILWATNKEGEMRFTSPFSMITMFKQPTDIICIKGVSDNETRYNLLNL